MKFCDLRGKLNHISAIGIQKKTNNGLNFCIKKIKMLNNEPEINDLRELAWTIGYKIAYSVKNRKMCLFLLETLTLVLNFQLFNSLMLES